MTAPVIVLIEDSEPYIIQLLALLHDKLHIPQESVQVIRTEVEFYSSIPELEAHPPALFIVDVMVPYQAVDDNDDAVPPGLREKAKRDRFYRAGIRCVNYLLDNPKLRNIPIVLHSILDKSDMESDQDYPIPIAGNVSLCKKEANGYGIIEAAERFLKLRPA